MRIQMNETPMDAIFKMSDGNPGAITAITEIMLHKERIDPQAMGGGLFTLMDLDEKGIYGTDIYILYSDKCGKNVRRLIMLLRAVQLGKFSSTKLLEMAKDQMGEVNLSEQEFVELDKQVCEQLDQFERPSNEVPVH